MRPDVDLLGDARDSLREFVLRREGWTRTDAGDWRNELGHVLPLGKAYADAAKRLTPVGPAFAAKQAVECVETSLAMAGGFCLTVNEGRPLWRKPDPDGLPLTLSGAADYTLRAAKRRALDAAPPPYGDLVVDAAPEWNQLGAGDDA